MEADMFEECIKNTVEVADKCHLIIEMGKYHIPYFELPPNFTSESYLEYLTLEGIKSATAHSVRTLKSVWTTSSV